MNTVPQPEAARRVDQLAIDYLTKAEDGLEPDIDVYLGELGVDERCEFRSLIDTATWARRQFPVTVRSHLVIAGRYELLRELGSGGFGKVWAARDIQLGREVAVKVMSLVTGSSLEAAFVHDTERQALARMRHPGAVSVTAAGRDGDVYYIVMPLLDGRSIEKVVSRIALAADGRAPTPADLEAAIGTPCPTGETGLIDPRSYPRSVARVVSAILQTLESVHEEGVIHRDLKPSNVMLCGGARPVILDFGMASLRDLNRRIVTERLVGTMNYLAPEQLQSQRVGADARTDVYQAGLILYELLTLAAAYSPTDPTTIIDKIRNGDFARPRRLAAAVPRELEDVCLRAIECNPQKRYQSAAEFRADLERWLSGTEVPIASRRGRIGGAIRSVRYLVRRHRTAALVAAALLFGIVPTAWLLSGESHAIRMLQVDMPSERSIGLVLAQDSPEPQTVVALVVQQDEQGDRWYLPLVVEPASAAVSRELPKGVHDVALAAPHGQQIRTAGFSSSFRVYNAAGDAKGRELREIWNELVQQVERESSGGPGLHESDYHRILKGRELPGRGDPRSRSDLPLDRLAQSGSWCADGAGCTEFSLP